MVYSLYISASLVSKDYRIIWVKLLIYLLSVSSFIHHRNFDFIWIKLEITALENVVEVCQPLYVLFLRIVKLMKTMTSPSQSH
jgi:hypothetical protein